MQFIALLIENQLVSSLDDLVAGAVFYTEEVDSGSSRSGCELPYLSPQLERELGEFVKCFGHCNVVKGTVEPGSALLFVVVRWCQFEQRAERFEMRTRKHFAKDYIEPNFGKRKVFSSARWGRVLSLGILEGSGHLLSKQFGNIFNFRPYFIALPWHFLDLTRNPY